VSELLEVRVIGGPDRASQAVARLGELLELDRQHGPSPSRKAPGLVRYYLTGKLRPTDPPAPAGQVERLEHHVARLRAALELLTACDHGRGPDCPDCEPVPDLVRQALSGAAAGRTPAATTTPPACHTPPSPPSRGRAETPGRPATPR
jgi:hypothetical protein